VRVRLRSFSFALTNALVGAQNMINLLREKCEEYEAEIKILKAERDSINYVKEQSKARIQMYEESIASTEKMLMEVRSMQIHLWLIRGQYSLTNGCTSLPTSSRSRTAGSSSSRLRLA